jgi:hypothetical protein
MKQIKYVCVSLANRVARQPNAGETIVYGNDLYDAKLELDKIMRKHINKGDTIVYRNRHSMRVSVND